MARSLPLVPPESPVAVDPCDGCAADCCRGFHLVIHGWDAYRIGRDLHLPLERFVALEGAPTPGPNYQLILDANAPARFYHRLELRRDSGACVFLMNAGGIGRCGIYASRPTVCRAYPLLDAGTLELTKREYCPPGAWDQIDEPLYVARYRFGQRQRQIHDVVGDGWNERVLLGSESRSPTELFAYLMESYAELERAQPRWFDDAPLVLAEEEMRAGVVDALGRTGWLGSIDARGGVLRSE